MSSAVSHLQGHGTALFKARECCSLSTCGPGSVFSEYKANMNAPLGFIKISKFIDQLSDYRRKIQHSGDSKLYFIDQRNFTVIGMFINV